MQNQECKCPNSLHYTSHLRDGHPIVHTFPFWCMSIVAPQYKYIRDRIFEEGISLIHVNHYIALRHADITREDYTGDLFWIVRNNNGILEVDSWFDSNITFCDGYTNISLNYQ